MEADPGDGGGWAPRDARRGRYPRTSELADGGGLGGGRVIDTDREAPVVCPDTATAHQYLARQSTGAGKSCGCLQQNTGTLGPRHLGVLERDGSRDGSRAWSHGGRDVTEA